MNLKQDSPRKRIGIIGFGKLGLLHSSICQALEESEVAFVVDQPNSLLDYFKTLVPTLPTYRSLEQAVAKEQKPDGVFICTPTNTHGSLINEALTMQLPVFVEKPMVSHWSHVPEVLGQLKRSPQITMVGYMSRYMESFNKAKSILLSGCLGEIQMVEGRMYIGQLFEPGKGWRYSKKESGGGVLMTQNSHLIDMLLWLFGDVQSLHGHSKSIYSKEVEDYFHGTLLFANGATGFIDTSWSKRNHRTLSMDISAQGQNGTLNVNEDVVRLWLEKPHRDFAAGAHVFHKPELFTPVPFEVTGAHYTRQTQAFLEAITTQKDCESNFISGAKTQAAIEALYRSAESSGSRMSFADVWNEAL